MPEGPSIVILKEELQQFSGRKILGVSGNVKTFDKNVLQGLAVLAFKSWGKHTLICFDDFTIRIHFLMFGSCRINENKETEPRLRLEFENGFVNFYSSSIKLLEGKADEIYNWSGDVMNNAWDEKAATAKVMEKPDEMICDTLLDQDIFAGVGNIIKNEVLYLAGVQPESRNGQIPKKQVKILLREARDYSFRFYEWKKQYVLKQHWQVHTKKVCPTCNGRITLKHTGFRKRRSFYCERCQRLYEQPLK